ncbi:TldD/PmbA family protein [Sutcliffiella halmapala]|uniref:TldD/PmbA family protein n=1 Tax=Sutcliffiella halmapala TaxID=79882 RepID=UPI00099504A7|nr:TldD/PmbA family protein [Sutcliffiella halmapala]
MQLQEFQVKLFDLGENHGFTDMELYYEREVVFGCKLYEGEIDSFETADVFGVNFRGIVGGKIGYAFTEIMDEESLLFLVENAKANSQIVEDEEQEEILPASSHYQERSFCSNQLEEVSIADKINLLKNIEKHLYKDERVTGADYFQLSSVEAERAILNNKGLTLQEKQNYLAVLVSAIVKQDAEIKTGHHIEFTKDFSTLNPEEIARKAVEEALSQLDAQSVESKNYPVLLRHDAAANLMATFTPIFSAENTQKGHSLLKDRVGQEIAVTNLQLVDDPFLEEGLFSRTFDSEGSATAPREIIKDGKLVSFLHNHKTAKKDKVQSTGHAYRGSYKDAITVAPTNFYVVPAEKSFRDLVSSMKEGIVITSLSGLHSGANTVSGDFSVAANGHYIKNGQITNAVKQMTIAGNFYELLHNIETIGSDLKFTTSFVAPGYIGSPSLLIKELAVTVE